MTTTFLEPGGDATFNGSTTTGGGFWSSGNSNIVTDFVHGNHVKSIKYAPSTTQQVRTPVGTVADAGTRISVYVYFVAFPTTTRQILGCHQTAGNIVTVDFDITSTGVIQLGQNGVQIKNDGPTLSLNRWYRISLAYTITDSTHNELRLFVDGAIAVSATNVTLNNITGDKIIIGNVSSDTTFDFRSSDHYIDNSSALTDPGNIWVTAKRPNASGTANNFSTQIGSSGSGYGTGHSPQVNERALSTTNGWSIVAVGATTEEYNIESRSTGDIDITGETIVDYMGWVYAKALLSETGSIVVNGASSNIALTSTTTMFTKAAGSTTYPVGTGTDIGMITDATATTVSLYECGVMVAFIPKVSVIGNYPPYIKVQGGMSRNERAT